MNEDLKFEIKNPKVTYEIGYLPPYWSSLPRDTYTLDVWREGVIVETINVSEKEYYIIGRNDQVCDIFTSNITVSRAHCVLQHKDDGSFYIYDLDSAYGTYVNKTKIAKKTYIKLKLGDTFKIGQSSRMFIVNGPYVENEDEEEDPGRGYIQIPQQNELLENRINQIKEQYQDRENYKRNLLSLDQNVVWGQRDFEEEISLFQKEEEANNNDKHISDEYQGEFNLEELKQRKDLNSNQRGMIHKIENLIKGMKNLKDEIIKLKTKEMDQGDITEGQKKRMSINENKLKDLNERLETVENNLRTSLTSKEDLGNVEQRFDKKFLRELDLEDEYFDRAKNENFEKQKNTGHKHNQVITENYETLKVKLEDFIRLRLKLTDKLHKIEKDSMASNGEELDTLDKYIMETTDLISNEEKINITRELSLISKEITKTQKLLSLVTPSHIKLKPSNLLTDTITSKIEYKEKVPIKNKKVNSIADTISRLSKLKKKMAEETYKKFTDSDEEIIEEVENYKEFIGKEVELDENFKKKVEEFKRNMAKQSQIENQEEKGGLIITSKTINPKKVQNSNNPDSSNLFREIVSNIKNPEFELNNYKNVEKFLKDKTSEKTSKHHIEIDYSTGGLQTFNNYIDEMEKDESFSTKKRDRQIYKPTPKPPNRNIDAEDPHQIDYDAIYTVGEKSSIEQSVDFNPFRKNYEDI